MSLEKMVQCTYCNGTYNLFAVEVIARYSDCSMWKCPHCQRVVDDRGETGWKSTKDYYPIGERADYPFEVFGQGYYRGY